MNEAIVVIGGGHAGAQACASLAEAGLGAATHLVCNEPHLPYQRPPLSKRFLGDAAEVLLPHRGEAWYAQAGVTLHLNDGAERIDRARRVVRLRSGREIGYRAVILATGARARRLPGLPDELSNVAPLRGADDAQRLRRLLGSAGSLLVLGGGFVGLEVAATARALGRTVTVVEAAPRLLSRSTSPELAEHVLATHRAAGIEICLDAKAAGFDIEGTRLAAITVDGVRRPIDLLVPGIGATPDDRLAREAGLACDDGVLVDEYLRTGDEAIWAIGDCARFVAASGARSRLESVQNANDQARTAVAGLAGQPRPYRALPWFWSEQGRLRLQMAGLMPPPGDGVTRWRRGAPGAESFSILHYAGSTLVCVETVNSPPEHLAARKLLEAGRSPPPEAACDTATPLKSWQ